jgi:hypothetical protein
MDERFNMLARILPLVGSTSALSPASMASRVLFPALVNPIQMTANSGLGGGVGLQQIFLYI